MSDNRTSGPRTVPTAFDAGKGAIGLADLMAEVEARFGRERTELFAATHKRPPSPVPPPDTREALLKEVERRRRILLEQTAEDGLSAGEVRLVRDAEIVDWLLGKINGDYYLGPLAPLWMTARRLGVENLPAWNCEPTTGPEAVQFLDALAARLRATQAADGGEQPQDSLDTRASETLGPGKTKGKNINARMLEMLQEDSSRLGWSAGDWAGRLKCSKSSVTGTKAWKNILDARALRKAEDASSADGKFDRRRIRKKKRPDS